MALTPAEQAELDQLEQQQHDHVTREFGDPVANNYVAAVSKPMRPEDETHSSLFRTIFGGVFRDPIANAFETAKDVAQAGENLVAPALGEIMGRPLDNVHVPDLPGSEHAGTIEKVGRSLLSFAVPFIGWQKVIGGAEAGLSVGQKILKGVEAGALTEGINQDPRGTNLASTLKDTFGLDDPALNALAYNADNSDLVERLKAVTTNIPLDIAAGGLFELGAKGIRMYRDWRGAAEEAKGIASAMEHDYGIKRPKVAAEDVNPETESDALMAAGTPSEAPFDNTIHSLLQDNPPKSWEDVITFLNRMVDDPNIKPEIVDELAKIAHDDPENALTRLGIDPAKLDYGNFEKPEAVQALHNALINVYEKVGKVLGRTGETVSEASIIHTAARAFASDADVLRALFGKTKNLPEILMGARMFVGGHSKKLLDDAQAALDALRSGEDAGDPEWHKFLETFYRHALYLGSLRGAGSEIARSLKSLQFIARHDPKQAIKEAETLAMKVPAGEPAAKTAEEDATKQLQGLLGMDDHAERMMALSKLIEKEGDTGSIAMFVRRQNGSALKQLDGVVREEVGNLFSQGTAAYNFAASMTMMSLHGLGRWMSAAARLPLALMGGEQARLARIAAMDAWAYTDGAMMGWAEAWRNMLTALKADLSTELFLNADNLGLKRVAKLAAEWNVEGSHLTASGKNFERVDMRAAQHIIALSPSDRRAIDQWAEHYGMPRLMEGALKYVARAAGVAINAAGTATRAGTILFVNAPDQLAGSLAAKAGAQSAAVREAAIRAADLGIEGKALTKYLKARVASLTADTEGWADPGYEEGFRSVTRAAGEHEARAVLFQDRLELGINRAMTKVHHDPSVLLPLAVPFLHTPLRILERSLIDYTPLGLLKSRFREAILRGTPQQREQALSQMALGIMGMYLGWHLAGDRTIVGKDGTFYSTARLARKSYTIHAFGDTFDYSRLDPIATIWGLASDFHAYMNTYYDPTDPQAESQAHAMFEAGAWAIAANVLSKTYLQGLADLADLTTAMTEGQFKEGFNRYWQNLLARRNVPGAGIQKGVRQTYDPFEHEAISFYDKVLKETIGATKLPIKRDWLGDEVRTDIGTRTVGLSWEPYRGDEDPLLKQLDELSLDSRLPKKVYKGVQLNAQQYSRLLELRGHAVDGKYGKMRDALEALIKAPGWDGLTNDAKEFQVKTLTEGYTSLAAKQLLKEDKVLQGQVWLEEAYNDAKSKGAQPDELQRKVTKFKDELQQLGYLDR